VEKSLTLNEILSMDFPHPCLAVLGDPISHSLSPAMHHAALQALASSQPQLSQVNYLRLHIKPEELAQTLTVLRNKNFIGLNLTVPHKVAALSLVKSLSPEARKAESINTLVPTPDGWAGHTTDGQGFLEALKEYSGSGVTQKDVIILGAGGAARAIAAACLQADCRSLLIANRDITKAKNIVAALNDARVSALGLKEVSMIKSGTIVVNCTTLGLKPDDELPLAESLLKNAGFIFDTTYGAHQTSLIKSAKKLGVKCCDGRSMLRWQGALAFKLWTGITPPHEPMRTAIGEK
jgi:shikimate dehydrogenase